jgi:glycosyltransferase involved in cell wall biosynthesis
VRSRPLVLRLLPSLDFGGAESRVVLQSRMSREQRDYELAVCCFHRARSAARKISDAGVPVYCLEESPSIRRPRATFVLWRFLRRLRPDVLHASISEAVIHGLAAGLSAGIRTRIAEEVGMPSHGRLVRRLLSLEYQTATRIVGVTREVADYVIREEGAPEERTRHIYNCADPSFFPRERATPASRAPAEPFRLLHVGRLTEVKNQKRLLEAFSISLRGARAELHMVGEGELRQELERLSADLGVSKQVVFHGYHADPRGFFARAHAYVLPSHSEGCSISLIEAMASGLPAIGSRARGIVEVLGEGHAANWCKAATDVPGLAAAMRRMTELRDSERLGIGKSLQERAYHCFSPRAYGQALQQLYREASNVAI